MYQDLDLSSYDSIKNVYLLGSKSMMNDHKIKLSEKCKIFKIYHEENSDISDIMPMENEILLSGKASNQDKQKIWDYEHLANKSRVVTYNFSSGSTGPPKVQLYKNQFSIKAPLPTNKGLLSVFGYRRVLEIVLSIIRNGFRYASAVNFNGFTCSSMFITQMAMPTPFNVTNLDQKKPNRWAPLLKYWKVSTVLFYSPQIGIFHQTDSFKKTDLSSLVAIVAGGAATKKELQLQFEESFRKYHQGQIPPYIKQIYSSTECGLSVLNTPWTTDENVRRNSTGKPTWDTIDWQVRIRHLQEDRYCEVEEEGEIEILSPTRMLNYFHHIDRHPIGWIQMGDVGYLDKDGNLFVTGRIKDIIVLENCKKINASDVEKIFQKSSLVTEVCVKPKPNDNCFDDIHVFIYSQYEAHFIEEYSKEAVPKSYNVKLHIFNHRLPKLPNGKFNGIKMIKNL